MAGSGTGNVSCDARRIHALDYFRHSAGSLALGVQLSHRRKPHSPVAGNCYCCLNREPAHGAEERGLSRTWQSRRTLVAALAIVMVLAAACSRASKASYKDVVQRSLEQAGLKGVTVDEDRDKNTITLGGTVHSVAAKDQAGQVAQSVAGRRTIVNQISIEPPGLASQARSIESNVDSGIESNYKAALIANGLAQQNIRYTAKNGVLTLRGKVKDPQQRQAAEQIAQSVPNVGQVVNQLEINR
jgi:osmotically-inducible protein OsmY